MIRQAQQADIPALEELERSGWDPGTTPRRGDTGPVFGHRIPLENTWVYAQDGVPVGYVAIGPRTPLPANAHVGLIRSLVVDRGKRRGGIGRALIAEAERQARLRGYRKLDLTVLGSNGAAFACYTSLGFQVEGRLRGEFLLDGQWVDDIWMGKWLDEQG